MDEAPRLKKICPDTQGKTREEKERENGEKISPNGATISPWHYE